MANSEARGISTDSEEKMEMARLMAQLARVTMEHVILKKATAYFARKSL